MPIDGPRQSDESALDEALNETFPASDPPANTIETAVRPEPTPGAPAVTDNHALNRYEIHVGQAIAFLNYERRDKSLTIIHTEVPAELRGRHLGEALVKAAVDDAHRRGDMIVVACPFAREYLRRHPPAG
jgi:uncharacterized protein